jgi:ABC-type polar amino acid transport system ATPase subunit
MLQAKNIYKGINGTAILKDINIKVEPSKITCLIGPSGGGKSTALSCLSLLTNPSKGIVIVDGQEFNFDNGKNVHKPFPYPKVTVVFQGLFLFPHLNNETNILMPLKEQNKTTHDFDSLIDKLNIREVLRKFPNQCSGGEKQRVALARQILLEPKYLLLDEVTSALDLETVNTVAKILIELKNKGTGILLVTHMINLAKTISDNFYFLDKGVMIEEGNIAQLNKPQTDRLAKFLQIYS